MPQIHYLPRAVLLDTGADLLAGAKAYFYVTNTTTPKNTYSDYLLTVPNTNPVIADANGVFQKIYLSNDARYRVTYKTSADVLLYTEDDIGGPVITQAEAGAILYPQTSAELAAGVTPTNYAYAPGMLARYGGAVSASAATNTAALQAALDSNQVVSITESGTYSFNDTIKFNDNNILSGSGLGTKLQWNVTSKSLIEGKTKASARQYRWGLRDLVIDNTDRTNAGAIGIDLSNLTDGLLFNVIAQNVETGFYGVSAQGSLQCALYKCLASTTVTALTLGTLTNEWKFFDFRVADCTNGVFINDNSGHKFFAPQIEAFTGTAWTVGNTATAQYVGIYGPRLENTAAGASVGFTFNGASAATLVVLGPVIYINVFTLISNVGTDLLILDPSLNSPEVRTNRLALGSGNTDNAQWAYLKATASAEVTATNSSDSGPADIKGSDIYANRFFRTAGAASGAASTTTFGNATGTTIGAAGGASALPATPLGYIIAYVGTTQVKIPYYNP